MFSPPGRAKLGLGYVEEEAWAGLGWTPPVTRAFEGITPAPRPAAPGPRAENGAAAVSERAAERRRATGGVRPRPAAAARPPHSAGDSAAALPPAAPGGGCSPVTEFPKMYPLEYLA